MQPKIIRTARSIPQQFRQVVEHLFDEAPGDYRRSLAELQGSVTALQEYIDEAQRELGSGAIGGKRAAQRGRAAAAPVRGTRRRRGGKRFPTGDFVLTTLKAQPKGMRPRDVAAMLKEKAPGAHKSPISVVNTTLARLAQQKHVVNRGGIWSAKVA